MTTTTEDITTVPLTGAEEARLCDLEEIVTAGLETFVKVGTALAEIRDSKLYRQTHSTFVDYLADRWDYSESRGYQLIESARISTMVEVSGLPPIENERQARELSGLNDPDARRAWELAIAETAGRPTATTVAKARQDIVPAARNTTPKQPRRGAITDQAQRAGWDARKVAERLGRLAADDRFTWNRDALRPILRGHLQFVLTSVEKMLADLGDDPAQDTLSDPQDDEQPVVHARGARRPVTLVSGQRSAYCGYEYAVTEAIKRLGITAMPDRDAKRKRRCIPADRLDDLVAALETAGHRVEVVGGGLW